MINLLLICNNLRYIEELTNNIMCRNSKVRLYNICTSVQNALNVIQKNISYIDIIILKLPKEEIVDFFDELNEKIKYHLENSIIVVADEKFDLSPKYFLDIGKVIISNSRVQTIAAINNLCILKQNVNNYNFVNKYLYKLGYNHSHLGTKYISEILLILLKEKYKECPILKNTIYPIIAERHNTTVHNVKCTITLATKYMNSKNTLSKKEKFGIFKVDNYINTKSVINYIIKKQPYI